MIFRQIRFINLASNGGGYSHFGYYLAQDRHSLGYYGYVAQTLARFACGDGLPAVPHGQCLGVADCYHSLAYCVPLDFVMAHSARFASLGFGEVAVVGYYNGYFYLKSCLKRP